MTAEEALKQGNIDEALDLLKEQVKKNPADFKLRVFLFQLFCVQGKWDSALTQLNLAADLDASALPMAQMYREALNCEVLRQEVFDGKRTPLIMGEPPEWIGLLIESVRLVSQDKYQQAADLRNQAFEAAETIPGSINGDSFEWIADADTRLGPVLEIIVNGRYYWAPFANITRIDLEEPADLRDFVWMPCHFQFSTGGSLVGLIPTRYPDSEQSEDAAVRLSRKTDWMEKEGDNYLGLGQRVLATDQGEYPLMDIRALELQTGSGDEQGGEASDG